jgi:uncharacterized protein YdeI (YjbR/CyaY-like superfamily)
MAAGEKRAAGRSAAPRATTTGQTLTAFTSQAALRAWLNTHHRTSTELLLRVYKTHASHLGVTYKEALDEALCFGWIDGVRRSVDENSFSIRFTPRKPRSIWSRVNVGHAERLIAEGRMKPAGRAAFTARDAKRTAIYSFESTPKVFPPEMARKFKANTPAWAFFAEQAPWYRRTVTHWVLTAKKEETRARRLDALIDWCARRTIAPELKRKA